MAGLFEAAPRQQHQTQFRTPEQAIMGAAGNAGGMFAQGITGAMGARNEQQDMRKAMLTVQKMGLDPSSPDYYAAAAKVLSDMGYPDKAQMAMEQAQKVKMSAMDMQIKQAQVDKLGQPDQGSTEKLIAERNRLAERLGEAHPYIKAIDNKLAGISSTKATKSDRVMELARKQANGTATRQEMEEFRLLTTTKQETGPPGAFNPAAESKTNRDNARQQEEQAKSNIARIESLIADYDKTPAAAGISGAAIETAGGLVGQIPGVGKKFREWIGANDVKRIRTEGKWLVAGLLSTITGDTSGRYTDTERKIAAEALATLNLVDSADDVMIALNVALGAEKHSLERSVRASGRGVPPTKEAIEYLRANPQFKQYFIDKYGVRHLPEGL